MEERRDCIEKFDSIKEHFIYYGNPTIFWHSKSIIFKDKIERKFDSAEIVLLSNSSWNLKYCIDIAKYFLNLSSKKSVEKLTNKKPDSFENLDRYEDHIRAIEHRFLLPSILFYNACFDYLFIFVFSLIKTRKEIVNCNVTKIANVLEETEYLKLSNKKYSWMFALNSLITRKLKFKEKGKMRIEDTLEQFFLRDFINIFKDLKAENEELRIKYYANIIKHQQIPFFKPKCLDNLGGAKSFVDINKFYSIDETTPSITYGIPKIVLDIEKTQKFLVQYHNITIKTFNYLLNKIYME